MHKNIYKIEHTPTCFEGPLGQQIMFRGSHGYMHLACFGMEFA